VAAKSSKLMHTHYGNWRVRAASGPVTIALPWASALGADALAMDADAHASLRLVGFRRALGR